MKPLTSKTKEIRRAKYKLFYYKEFIKLFRNKRIKDYKNEQALIMS